MVIILVIVGICGAFGYDYYTKHKKRDVVLYGNVEIRQVNLGFQVPGKLEDMKYDEGDKIKEGELLAKLDKKPYKVKLKQANAQLFQANAQLLQAKANLNNANIYYKRNIDLCKRKAISKQECDNINTKKKDAEAMVESAKAMVEYAKAMIDEATLSLDYTELYAPSNGIIITRINEKGTILGAGSPVYTLSLNDKMWARAFIEETYLGKVQLGQKVKISTDSTDKIYTGTIGFISPVAEFTPKNIETPSLRTDLVYRVRIVIDDADNYLKQGMPITIKLD